MPWTTEGEKRYWLPEVFPELTEEHQNAQSEKLYLTKEGKERRHPGWTYAETNAYVDDGYLFQNEGWKVIVGNEGNVVMRDSTKQDVKNDSNLWEQVDEKTLRVTYTLSDLSQEEIDKKVALCWRMTREKRDLLLQKTDWIILKSVEKSLVVLTEVHTYRQQLRDFPSTISNILEFEIDNDNLWPTAPSSYFEA